MRALLDVNVLIALLDATHVHHGAAVAWLCANIEHGWVSCPITQNGLHPHPVPTGLSEPLATGAGGRALARGHGHGAR